MVDVGVGMTPGSDWAVVAVHTDDWPEIGKKLIETWLTTTDGYTKWINIGFTWDSEVSSGWRGVSWTGDRLARGKAAQAMAVTCLSSQLATG